MNQPAAQERFTFGTKAETLDRLSTAMAERVFCDQIIVPVSRWRSEPDAVIEDVLSRFSEGPLAVRSSAAGEDGWASSMAGHFASFTAIAAERGAVAAAIDRVVASYDGRDERDQILVQPSVRNVSVSGVVLTRELDTGGPYYVVSYDDFSGRTDTVTGGAESKTILVHRARPEALHSTRFRRLIEIVREIERVTECQELDIEFCITGEEEVRILQVRPLAVRSRWQRVTDARIDPVLAELRRHIVRLAAPAAMAGRTTCLGEMPDWNPAEMIGNAPRRLAFSLYRTLITDDVWWRARGDMGYRAVPHPLLVDLGGRPYVDVRLSLNSFLPAALDDSCAHALVDQQIDTLAANRELHDKIEFEVAITCLDFDFERRAAALRGSGIGIRAIDSLRDGLRAITGKALAAGPDGLGTLLARTEKLEDAAEAERLPPLAQVGHALKLCRAFGTLPFAGLARHGFIAVALMRSLVARGALAPEQYDSFMRGIETVASALVQDMHAVAAGNASRAAFLARYGHLRPGTYDILSWRYDERPDLYLDESAARPQAKARPARTAALKPAQLRAIESLAREAGFSATGPELLDYVAAAIAAREEAKFRFSRTLSNALKTLRGWGESIGVSADDLSHVEIGRILDLDGDRPGLLAAAAEGREAYQVTRSIRLPHLIVEPDDIDVVRMPLGKPNFITNEAVTTFTRLVTTNAAPDIDGCIVLIESADPGFDWIFSHPIAGLITKYGGANSHMAIRCAEFGLPAAIGCGERLFGQLAASTAVELNCGARVVRPAAAGPVR